MAKKSQAQALSDESTGVPYGELIRDYEPPEGSSWRYGRPDYASVNKLYFQHRTMAHQEGSLEALVQKLVKNWQVESLHITDVHNWKTMDTAKFKLAVNGGCPCNAQFLSDVGHPSLLVGETVDYSQAAVSHEGSRKIFGDAFPEGFAWEILEVYSGPPNVLFKWRHFGKYSGTFVDKAGGKHKGSGEMLNLVGMCLAKVNERLAIETLDVYYNPEDMTRPLTSTLADPTQRPLPLEEADPKVGVGGCKADGKSSCGFTCTFATGAFVKAMGSGASRPQGEKYQASAEASSEEAKVTKTQDRPLPPGLPQPEPTAQTAAGESAAASSGRPPLSEAERSEVLSALDRARATALRSLSNRARRLLAESAVIHELGPGASLGGVEAWYHGQCLVLSGQASVMLYPPRPTVRAIPEDEVAPSGPMLEVALVKRGDTFGWHRQHKADLTDEEILLQETWDNCSPEVVVPANMKLKFARLEDSDDHRGEHRGSKSASGHALKAQKSASKTKPLSKEDDHAARPLQGLHTSGVTSTFNFLPSAPTSSFLAQLWLTSTPPLEGIADNTAANGGLLPRAHFQATLWSPLLDCLDQLNEEIRRRQRAKYRIHDCFPLQGHQIVELKHYIIHLTEIWYGARRGGNLSILYSWFVDAMGVLGVTAYSYDDLPVDKSSDAWATVIDGDARRRALQGRTGMDSAYVATGGVAQKQGRSAIDNTVLRNVFYPWEARELLVGRMARKFLSRLLALRQRSILRRLAQHLQLDVLHLAQDARTHRSLRSILAATSDEEIKVLGLDPQDRLLLLLRRTGAEIAGFGQLDEGMQRSVWEAAKTCLKETATPLQQEPAEGTPKACRCA
ncbi:unnamed protein product, partial [Symbiodinium sp. CCMP2456]